MSKEKIIQLVKNEIQGFVEEITDNNIHEINEAIRSQLKILDCIHEAIFRDTLPDYSDKNKQVESDDASPTSEHEDTNESDDQEMENTLSDPNEDELNETVNEDRTIIRGYFNQLLRGGTINKKHPTFIPERYIRELDIKQGDFIQATLLMTDVSNKAKYSYEVIKRTDKTYPPARIIESMAIVKVDDTLKQTFVEFQNDEDELPIRASLNLSDLSAFNIRDGDVVDYSHEPNKPLGGRVIWKHHLHEVPTDVRESLEKADGSHVGKPQTKQSKTSSEKTSRVQPIFEGLHILTIGGKNLNLHKTSQEEVVKRKGQFTALSGDENQDRIVSQIRRADLIVIYTESISHHAMYLAKDTCKKHAKVCSYTKNIGGKRLVRKLSDMRKKLEIV